MTPKNRAEYRELLAKEFLRSLSEKGLDWKRGWNRSGPMNAVTKREYHGINRFYLSMVAWNRGYQDPRWATMVQIMDKKNLYHPGEKWHLKAGSKAIYVEYWYPYDTQLHRALSWGVFRRLPAEERSDPRYILRVSYTPVFHASQIDGIPAWIPETGSAQRLDQLVDTISKNMDVVIAYDGGDRAYYSPGEDRIHLPQPAMFHNEYELNSTALHELAHATGASSRLDRACCAGFGTPEYAYEELIAEISSCFMSIDIQSEQTPTHIKNHIAYVQSWIQIIQDQPEVLIRAVNEAQRVAGYMEYKAELVSEEEYITACSKAPCVPQTVMEKEAAAAIQDEISVREFEMQVDAALSHRSNFSNSQISLGGTPASLAKYGFRTDLPLVVRSRKIREMHQLPKNTGANRHGLSVETIKKLPEAVAAPAIVMISRTRPSDSIIVVSDMTDSLNRPVILAIQANSLANVNRINIVVNSLNSAYGRDGFAAFLQRAYDENLILTVGEKNNHQILQSPWLQLPSGLQSGDYVANIARFQQTVNLEYRKRMAAAEDISSFKERNVNTMSVLKIYQLRDTPDNRERRWLDYNNLGKLGEKPELVNYDLVYQMPLRDTPSPEQVFQQFNLARPADFTGHSLSVSDVIAYQAGDSTIAYYVDSASFVRLPEMEEQLSFHLRGFEVKDMVYMANYAYGGQELQSAVRSQGDTLYVMIGTPPHSERFRHDLTSEESAVFRAFERSDAAKSAAVPLESTLRETVNADALMDAAIKTRYYFEIKSAITGFPREADGSINKAALLKSTLGTDAHDHLLSLFPEMQKPVIGFLRYLDSGETVDYTDPEKYIAAYREALYTQGPNAVRAVTLTPDPNVHYEIEKLLVGEFGEELPDKASWIAAHAANQSVEPQREEDAPELE